MTITKEDQDAILRAYCEKIMNAFGRPAQWYRSPEYDHTEKPVLPPAWFDRLKDIGNGYPHEVEYWTCEAAIDDAVKAHPGLKPWPRDSITVVAARAGQADLTKMEDIFHAACRDCGCKLHADTRSVRTASEILKSGGTGHTGSEVKFFCRDCVLFYVPTPVAVDGRGNPA